MNELKDFHRGNTKKFSICPYKSIGCDYDKETKDKVTGHLHKEELVHSRMLINWIEGINKKIAKYDEDFPKHKFEILALKEDSKKKEIQMTELILKLNEELKNKDVKIDKLKKYIDNISSEVNEIKEEGKLKEEQIQQLMIAMEYLKEALSKKDKIIENQRKDINSLKNEEMEPNNVTSTLNILKTNENELKNRFKNGKNEMEDEKINMNNDEEMIRFKIKQSFKESKEIIYMLKNTIERMDVWTHETFIVGETVFSVDRFSVRRYSQDVILSPYFYSHENGYKLRLKVYPGGDLDGESTHLSIFFVICKGEYDDELSWPCKYLIRISIINQNDREEHVSLTFDYTSVEDKFKHHFEKPTGKNNDGVGYSLFISFKDLESIVGLTFNDVILVKCAVTA